MISFAKKKLSPGDFAGDHVAQLAALDVRVHLAFDMAWASTREQLSRLVESYMRIVYAVPEHRKFVHSGYPSEPVLAEAAAQLLNRTDTEETSNRANIATLGPEILQRADNSRYLTRGERGEMVGRLLMTIAHDSAISRTNPKSAVMFHKPVKLLDFLRQLFHPKYHQTLLNAHPVNALTGSSSLEAVFQDAYISFSHFALAGDTAVIKLNLLYLTLLRGMAYQCAPHQTSIDLIGAIHFGNPATTEITEANTSVLQVQIKNRVQTIEPQNVFVNPVVAAPRDNKPVISLFLELGSDKSSVHVVSGRQVATRSRAPRPNDCHYLIVAYGCSSETFSAIPEQCDGTYQRLLNATQILDDFPRKNEPSNLGHARRQKAVFYNMEECVDWRGLLFGQEPEEVTSQQNSNKK